MCFWVIAFFCCTLKAVLRFKQTTSSSESWITLYGYMAFSDYPRHSLYVGELSLVSKPSRSRQWCEVKTSVVFKSCPHKVCNTWAYLSMCVHYACAFSLSWYTWLLVLSRYHTSVRLIIWSEYGNTSAVSLSSITNRVADSKLLYNSSSTPSVTLPALLLWFWASCDQD